MKKSGSQLSSAITGRKVDAKPRYRQRLGSHVAARRLRLEPLEDRCMLATITVTSLADNTTVNGQVTLREAVLAAESDSSVDGSTTGNGADTIQFASNLSGAVNLFIVGDTGEGSSALLINSVITIRGNANGITIGRDAATEMRLFRVMSLGNLALESLNLTGGNAHGANGGAGENGGDGRGGAILNLGTLEIVGCTLYNNQAIGGIAGSGGFRGAGRGGAIYNYEGNVFIRNSTLSSNTASPGTGPANGSGSFGGAIYSHNGSLTIDNSTITLSTANSGRSVYVLAVEGTADANIYSSIIGQSDLPTSGYDLTLGYDTNGDLNVEGSNNLIRLQNDFGETITVSTADPLLGSLQNNGGSTLTHAPAENSPAVDQGINPLGLATDQRGATYAREVGTAADIGAFERQTAIPPALPGDYNNNDFVDAADYIIWRKTLSTGVPQYSGADGSGNSVIDAADLAVWRQNFGNSPNQGAGASTDTATSASQPTESGAASIITRLEYRVEPQEPSPFGRGQGEGALDAPRSLTSATFVASPRDLALLTLVDDYCPMPEPCDSSFADEPAQGVVGERHEALAGLAIDHAWADWEISFDLI